MTSQSKLVTVFGADGFVGRYVVRALAMRGYRVKAACRRPDLAKFLTCQGEVGQIMPIQANLRYRWSVDRAVEGADAVVNLVAIARQSGKQKYASVHTFGARAVAEAARSVNADMIHISAIGVDADSPSRYGRTKAEAEQAVLETCKKAIIFRPSFIFGQEDKFFNRFANMTKLSPFVPVIAGGKTNIQPVYVADVAEAIARAVDGEVKGGKIYELGGPEVMTYREAMEEMLNTINRNRSIVSIPWFIAKGMARLTGWLPGAPLVIDELEMLRNDNVVSEEAKKQGLTFEGIGIQPTDMRTILPTYLVQYRPTGQFTRQGTV